MLILSLRRKPTEQSNRSNVILSYFFFTAVVLKYTLTRERLGYVGECLDKPTGRAYGMKEAPELRAGGWRFNYYALIVINVSVCKKAKTSSIGSEYQMGSSLGTGASG